MRPIKRTFASGGKKRRALDGRRLEVGESFRGDHGGLGRVVGPSWGARSVVGRKCESLDSLGELGVSLVGNLSRWTVLGSWGCRWQTDLERFQADVRERHVGGGVPRIPDVHARVRRRRGRDAPFAAAGDAVDVQRHPGALDDELDLVGLAGRQVYRRLEVLVRTATASVGGSFAAAWARMVLKKCSSERWGREKRF